DKQREAVVKFNKYKNGFFVLNGMAGTGKTFTVRAIIEVAKIINKNSNVKFVAPTGKATKVLKNSLYANGEGFMANVSTIHKELSPEESFYGNGVMSFKHNEYNKIDADIIVCDESSMIDSELMYHFMKAIDYDKTKVIFLGDTNQLSSIGCGNVLNDLINSKNVKTITLDKIKRQASDSGIVKNSLNAINGKPLESGIFNEDFYFVNTTNEQKSLNMTIKSIQRIQDIKKEDNLDNIQILSPTKKGACGTNNLNFEIKNKFMGHMSTGTSIELKKFNCLGERKVLNLNIGDKVIQTENKYSYLEYEGDVEGKDDFTFNENAFFELSKTTHSELISNGDDGVVVGFLNTINHLKYEGELFKKLKKENKAKNGASKTQLDICADEHLNDRCNKDKFVETKKRENKNYSAKYVLIKFENKVVAYQEAVLKQCIDLAYAITIHKSQGSQWNSVVCVFPSYVNRMLTKNLVYTAITRAEKFCVTIGKEEEISNGLKIDAAKRNTSLADFLGLKKSKKKKKKSSEKRYYGSYHKFN
ncbi:MAG: AAA family ATPase, partial [Peptostreptococcaceae bacterium]